MNVCTIIAKNYLAHARVLTESFQRHHPDGRCHVLVIDEVDGYIDAENEPFVLVRPDDIGLEAFEEMRAAYDVLELSTALKPWLLRHMLAEHDDGTGVAYLDPDIRVISRMVELEDVLTRHAVVLTPHVTTGMPRDGLKPSETDILMAGVYNLGFIGLSDRPDTHTLLDWWSERLLTDCHVAPERGLFVDQRWIDFVPGLIADLEILRHPAYNVAYWNLPERDLRAGDDGKTAQGRPLRFFHYSGYDPDHRDTLSKHQNRVRLSDPALLQICDEYGDLLIDAGYEEVRDLPYEHGTLPSGLELSRLLRGLYRVGVEAGEMKAASVFTQAGEAEFVSWLNEPAPAEPTLTQWQYALWAGRSDLRAAYNRIDDPDVRAGFVGWCEVHGPGQLGLTDALLHPQRREIGVTSDTHEVSTAVHTVAPETTRPAPLPVHRPFGVNVAGYLRSELGIGEIARQLVAALDHAGVPALAVGLVAPDSRQGHGYAAAALGENPFPVNIVCVNADGLPAFARDAGAAFFADRYTVGVWWWETSEFSDRHMEAFAHVDEVWVGSRFVAEAISAVAPVPVVHIPVAVDFPRTGRLAPGELGWPDAFTYLFAWDYCSVAKRKNPLGVIDAYTQAFDADAGTALVLKCINPAFDPRGHERVKAAIVGRPDILLIDEYLDPADKDRLMASCDCYVSLHRSEGFGLTMAEAMVQGKPVVATGYSGNTDFLTAENSWPVPYELVPIGDDAHPYAADGVWADPDTGRAAELLREVRDNPDEVAMRVARAAADLQASHSLEAVGEAVRARLERIAGRLPPAAVGRLPALRDQAPAAHGQRMVAATVPTAPSRYGLPGAALRRLILRLIQPYTVYQRRVNAALQSELDAVTATVDALVEQHDIDEALRRIDLDARLGELSAVTMAQNRRHARLLRDLEAELGRLRAEQASGASSVDPSVPA